MANNHAQAFKAIKGVKLVACCDINAKAAKAFSENHDVPSYYTDFTKMLDKDQIDAVSIIVSRAFTHGNILSTFNGFTSGVTQWGDKVIGLRS